jgi:20S proteasome subunit alpha 1
MTSSAADRFLTIFSPEGRLWQVEYAFKAVKQSEVTAIGAKGKNAVVVAAQRKVQDKLIDESTVTHMFRITEHVGACLVGLLTDVLYICRRLRYDAALFERKNGFEIPVCILANRLSEIHQLESQYVGLRPTAVSALLFGYEAANEDFALYRVEPSGFNSGYRAVGCGVKEVEAMSALEKKIQPFESERETAEFVISTLQTVVGVDFESKEIEVAVMTTENQTYRLMTGEEVDEILKSVSEKD